MKREIISYNPFSDALPIDLATLIRSHYGHDHHFNSFLAEYTIAYRYCLNSPHVSFSPFFTKDGGTPVGHIALITDTRLPQGEAFFGFMETPNDEGTFDISWNELIIRARAKKIRRLLGPVNGSIWHQYRCIKQSDGTPTFRMEPISEPYYYRLLRSKGPERETTYSSGIRESYDHVLAALATRGNPAERAKEAGFSIIRKRKIDSADLADIAAISRATFTKSWGYTELDAADFASLYDIDAVNDSIDSAYLIKYGTTTIGYCSTMREGAVLVCKTVCITPQYQGSGLGNALAYTIHTDARADGVRAVEYVLMRDGNQVHRFPTDDVRFFRQYATFDFDIAA